MPDELEDQNEEQEENQETGSEEEAESSSGAPEGDDDDGGEEEYFLSVNDRTRYKTQEDAVNAYNQAGERIKSYSRFGSPDEIAERLRKAELLEKVMGGGSNTDDDDPFGDLTPEQKAEWERFGGRFEKWAPKAGYVKADAVEEMVRQGVQRATQEQAARSTLESAVKARGITLTRTGYTALEAAVVEVANNDEEANRLWHEGDMDGFSERVLNEIYGPVAKKGKKADEDKGDGPERGEDGKFKRRADYDAAKDKTKNLPKPPAKGAGATAAGGEELSEQDRIDPVKRKQRALAMLEERQGN